MNNLRIFGHGAIDGIGGNLRPLMTLYFSKLNNITSLRLMKNLFKILIGLKVLMITLIEIERLLILLLKPKRNIWLDTDFELAF